MKLAMQLSRFFAIDFMGLLGRCKAPKVYAFSVMSDGGLPWFFRHPLFKGDALEPGCATGFAVGAVLAVRRFTEVGKSIVNAVAIDMINGICWPFPGHIKPRKPVLKMLFLTNFDTSVPLTIQPSGAITNFDFGSRGFPEEKTCFRNICNGVTKLGAGNHALRVAYFTTPSKD